MGNAELQVLVEPGTPAHALRRFPLPASLSVGRSPAADVRIDSPGISRRHLRLECDGVRLRGRDTSNNGSRVECAWIRGERLDVGLPATIVIGNHRLSFEILECPDTSVQRDLVTADERRLIHRRLLDALDLTRLRPDALERTELRREVQRTLLGISHAVLPRLSAERRDELVQSLTDEALGLGPIESLLADDTVDEILVVDPTTIFVERAGVLEKTRACFTDQESVRSVIERIVAPLGRHIDEASPLVDARLPDGSRVNAIIPPLALRGPCITIRKFPRTPLTMDALVDAGALSPTMAEFLRAAVRLRRNIVVAGGTGSGKTTLLNVLSSFIPASERIITIEDASELRLDHEHLVSLEARPANAEGRGAHGIADLVRNALRMRPDRIVVGECRGGEALDMLQAMNTGHEGSLTTIHASSPQQAISRLETLCLMSPLELPIAAIRRQIASSVHLIVQQARFHDGCRRVTEIAEVTGFDAAGDIRVQPVFRFHREADGPAGRVCGSHLSTGHAPAFLQDGQVPP